jgi:predicted outer membrane repeat protein
LLTESTIEQKQLRRPKVRPWLEALEDRLVPAVGVVRSAADDGGANTLRQVIRNSSTGDTINFDLPNPSTITLTQGEIQTGLNLTIDGGQRTVIITTNGNGRALDLVNSGSSVNETINNLTFRNCNPQNAPGGAIYVQGALSLTNDSFQSNQGQGGGAVSLIAIGPNDRLTVSNSQFTGNNATGGVAGYGGAINVRTGDDGGSGNVTLNKAQFTNNSAQNGGGAVYAVGGNTTTMTVNDSTFSWNTALNDGGAILTRDQLTVASVTTTSFFDDNQSTQGRGGAISWSAVTTASTSLTITGVAFDVNWAIRGGAVSVSCSESGSTATESITSCLFNSNRALTDNGGGLNVSNSTSSTGSAALAIENSTFYTNQAKNDGGGLAVSNTNDGSATNSVSLTSLTIYDNWSGNTGGGFWTNTPALASLPRIWNCILAGNEAVVAGSDVMGTIFSRGHNLVGTTDGSTGFDPSVDSVGTDNHLLDPGLDPQGLSNNGGWTQTIRLVAGSRAYETGDPALWLTEDQRGYTRIGINANGAEVVSIGAYDPDAA